MFPFKIYENSLIGKRIFVKYSTKKYQPTVVDVYRV